MIDECNDKAIRDEIIKIIDPIFDKVLQEHSKNLTLVGKSSTDEPCFSFFQPHAYRLCFDFSHKDFTLLNLPPKNQKLGYELINHKSEVFIEDYRGCSLRIRKRTITLVNFIEYKRWYAIDDFKAKEQMETITNFKTDEMLCVLKEFIKEFGGCSEYNLIGKPVADFKLQYNGITDMLKKDYRWITEKSKKVYFKKQVEIGDIYDAIHLVDNSTIFKYNEVIAEPIKLLAETLVILKDKQDKIHEDELRPKQEQDQLIDNIQLRLARINKTISEILPSQKIDRIKRIEVLQTRINQNMAFIEKVIR